MNRIRFFVFWTSRIINCTINFRSTHIIWVNRLGPPSVDMTVLSFIHTFRNSEFVWKSENGKVSDFIFCACLLPVWYGYCILPIYKGHSFGCHISLLMSHGAVSNVQHTHWRLETSCHISLLMSHGAVSNVQHTHWRPVVIFPFWCHMVQSAMFNIGTGDQLSYFPFDATWCSQQCSTYALETSCHISLLMSHGAVSNVQHTHWRPVVIFPFWCHMVQSAMFNIRTGDQLSYFPFDATWCSQQCSTYALETSFQICIQTI